MTTPMAAFVKKLFRHVIWRTGLGARRTLNRTAGIYWRCRRKRISAMMRVLNEEEFLAPSVRSIANLVEEIVIIDGLSTDNTPAIVNQLRQEFGPKVRVFNYPVNCARAGEEYHVLQRTDPKSPALLHNFYNWCLNRCTMPFVLKWDGDMLALPEFAEELEEFKTNSCLQFGFGGINVAPDRRNVLSPNAVIEPRAFPKMFSKFQFQGNVCETLREWVIPEYTFVVKEPLYLHLKYCKAVPQASFSAQYSQQWMSKIKVAGQMPPNAVKALEQCLATLVAN